MKHIHNFLVVSYETIMRFIFWLPRYQLFDMLKSAFLRAIGAKIGKGVIFYPGLWIISGKNLTIGNYVDLAKGIIITTDGGVKIGDRTLIGYRTQILSANHSIPPVGVPFPISGDCYKEVIIGKDVWIGANCTILPGVTVGEGAVIGAGSVCHKKCRCKYCCRR